VVYFGPRSLAAPYLGRGFVSSHGGTEADFVMDIITGEGGQEGGGWGGGGGGHGERGGGCRRGLGGQGARWEVAGAGMGGGRIRGCDTQSPC
jgi:hypothetical protein